MLTLLAGAGRAAAEGQMVGGEFAQKGVVTGTVGPNGAQGQPASVLTFTDDETKKLQSGHFSAALLFQTSSDWADAVTRGAEDEFKKLGIEIAGLSNSNFSASIRRMRCRRSWPRSRQASWSGPSTRMNSGRLCRGPAKRASNSR